MPSDPRQGPRVLHVVRPATGGMKNHVLQLAQGLRRRGFDCEIACPGDSPLVHDALEAGIVVHPVGIPPAPHPVRDPAAILALAETIRSRRPGIIHAHGLKAGIVARMANRIAGGRPVIVTVHNQIAGRSSPSMLQRAHIALERRLVWRTARIIAVSEEIRQELIDVCGIPARKIVTVRDGLDLAPFLLGGDRQAARQRYGIPPEAFAFGSAARFAPQKSLDVLLEASIPVLERYPNAWLVLAGDGPLLETIKTKARATSVRDRILFPGFETDMPGFLAALDVYASSPTAEGLGIAAVEAMASALPVVSTRVGGVPEVVEDGVTGVLVEPNDPAVLSQAIGRLVPDIALRRSMGEAGRVRTLDEFTEHRMCERTAEIYTAVLS